MSSVLVRPLLAAAFLAGAFVCAQSALAGVERAEDLLAGQLVPSAAPALLGPITSAGRKGWKCQPERAASTQDWHAAELPTATDSR